MFTLKNSAHCIHFARVSSTYEHNCINSDIMSGFAKNTLLIHCLIRYLMGSRYIIWVFTISFTQRKKKICEFSALHWQLLLSTNHCEWISMAPDHVITITDITWWSHDVWQIDFLWLQLSEYLFPCTIALAIPYKRNLRALF